MLTHKKNMECALMITNDYNEDHNQLAIWKYYVNKQGLWIYKQQVHTKITTCCYVMLMNSYIIMANCLFSLFTKSD